MNLDTGKIRMFGKDEALETNEVLVGLEQMTEGQKATRQVSKYDNRSELGKLFTGNRKQRREQEREWMREQKKKRRLGIPVEHSDE